MMQARGEVIRTVQLPREADRHSAEQVHPMHLRSRRHPHIAPARAKAGALIAPGQGSPSAAKRGPRGAGDSVEVGERLQGRQG